MAELSRKRSRQDSEIDDEPPVEVIKHQKGEDDKPDTDAADTNADQLAESTATATEPAVEAPDETSEAPEAPEGPESNEKNSTVVEDGLIKDNEEKEADEKNEEDEKEEEDGEEVDEKEEVKEDEEEELEDDDSKDKDSEEDEQNEVEEVEASNEVADAVDAEEDEEAEEAEEAPEGDDSVKDITESKEDGKPEDTITEGKPEDTTTEDKPEEAKTLSAEKPTEASGTANGDTQEAAKSSFVFGSGTTFGSKPFGQTTTTNVFGGSSVFGSSSAFGGSSFGSFGSSSSAPVKSIFGGAKEDDEEENADDDAGEETEDAASGSDQLYIQVTSPLQERAVETGEELEDSLFTCRARLYALDLTASTQSWKERGVGTLHVNREKSGEGRARIVMRSDAVLRVILNVPLVESTEVMRGMKSSLVSEKFVRVTGFEGEKPHQYAIKASNKDIASELAAVITDAVAHIDPESD